MNLDSYSGSRAARVVLMLLVLLACWSGVLHAQGAGKASILGTVMDSAGAVVPGASVQVKNIATGRVQEVPTDEQGRYTIADLPIGEYEAQASLAGFQTTVRRGIALTVGARAIVDFSLSVGRTQESLPVESQVSQVDTVSAAVVNAVTKSGTNDLHGSAYEFLRNSALDARNFFDSVKPPFRQNQFGGSLGGPIKKDKLFFFVNDEELRRSLSQTVIALVPDANAHNGIVNGQTVQIHPAIAPILALYPIPTTPAGPGVGSIPEVDTQTGNENYLLGRVDYTMSNQDSVFVRYVRDFGD